MNNKTKAFLSFVLLFGGAIIGKYIFVSKTELLLSLVYLSLLVLICWKWKWYKLYYIGALVCICVATFLFAIGPTMVRYVHYVDSASLWTFYFFATGVMFSAIDIFKGRGKKK